MSYQQRVYHWLVRHADPKTLHEIAAGTNLPLRVASFALSRLHKRDGMIKPSRSNGGRGIRWMVIDDSVTFIPDRRGTSAGSLAALIPGGRKSKPDMATDRHCVEQKTGVEYSRDFAPARNVAAD